MRNILLIFCFLTSSLAYSDQVDTNVERSTPSTGQKGTETPDAEDETKNQPSEKEPARKKKEKPLKKDDLEGESNEVQQGLTALENDQLGLAYKFLKDAIVKKPCDPKAFGGLLKIASLWGQQGKRKGDAYHIYTLLNTCKPDNPDILFYMGRQLSWMGDDNEAIKLMKRVLVLSPNYTDAAVMLGKLYIRHKKWCEAEALLNQYPHLEQVDFARAIIAFRTRNYCKAEHLYQEMLEKKSDNVGARRGLARSLSAQRRYRASKEQYAILVKQEPGNERNWVEYMDVRSHTNVAIFADGSYIKAKEQDPDLKAPVVRDYYTLATYDILVPISDRLRLTASQIFFHKKEDDIYPPLMGLNFNAYVQGAEMKSELLMRRAFKWDVILRVLGARGYNHNVFFPFASTTRFEPGTSLIYSDHLQFIIINSHVESFIIKNFDKNISELLRTTYLHAGYIFRPSVFLEPQIEGTFDEIFYHDTIRNRRNTVNAWVRVNLFTRYLRAFYCFQQSNFRHTTANYFSFKRQFRNTLGCLTRIDFLSRFYVEGRYEYRWQLSVELDQPIGAFNFQAAKQRIRSNKFIVRVGYRLKDRLSCEWLGHLFYTTLPYRDYKVQGNLLWQF